MKPNLLERLRSRFLWATNEDLQKAKQEIMESAKEQLDALNTQLDKVTGEILAEIKTLEDKIAAAGVNPPAEAQASFDALKAKIQALDDLNPDVPPAPPAPTP